MVRHTCYREGGFDLWSALGCDACAVLLMTPGTSRAPAWTPTDLASALTTYRETGAIPADESKWVAPSDMELARLRRLAETRTGRKDEG